MGYELALQHVFPNYLTSIWPRTPATRQHRSLLPRRPLTYKLRKLVHVLRPPLVRRVCLDSVVIQQLLHLRLCQCPVSLLHSFNSPHSLPS
jgi:hypothetical protein